MSPASSKYWFKMCNSCCRRATATLTSSHEGVTANDHSHKSPHVWLDSTAPGNAAAAARWQSPRERITSERWRRPHATSHANGMCSGTGRPSALSTSICTRSAASRTRSAWRFAAQPAQGANGAKWGWSAYAGWRSTPGAHHACAAVPLHTLPRTLDGMCVVPEALQKARRQRMGSSVWWGVVAVPILSEHASETGTKG